MSEPDFIDPWSFDIFARWQSAEQHRDLEAWIEAFNDVVGDFLSRHAL